MSFCMSEWLYDLILYYTPPALLFIYYTKAIVYTHTHPTPAPAVESVICLAQWKEDIVQIRGATTFQTIGWVCNAQPLWLRMKVYVYTSHNL